MYSEMLHKAEMKFLIFALVLRFKLVLTWEIIQMPFESLFL